MTAWEYRYAEVGGCDELNELGADGWEAVTVWMGSLLWKVVLKRPCGVVKPASPTCPV